MWSINILAREGDGMVGKGLELVRDDKMNSPPLQPKLEVTKRVH